MPLASPRYAFTEWCVRGAPEDPGLYALYEGNTLLCIGVAYQETIRAVLLALLHDPNLPSDLVTHYKWEISSNPLRRVQHLKSLGSRALLCEEAHSFVGLGSGSR